MEGIVTIEEARNIFGKNFIGKEELKVHSDELGIIVPEIIPSIPYQYDFLVSKADQYILVLGVSTMKSGSALTLLTLRSFFGINPDVSEPCFYNQDWYIKESFVQKTLELKWYLIRYSVYESSRAVSPDTLKDQYSFPSAIQCAFAFFATWFCFSKCLWENDFVWCSDKDHNNDRIYVGKYKDIDGINKSGFSIHRHLALRKTYASIDSL